MQQYFIDHEAVHPITLNEEQSHHITKVLRMREGTVIKIVDSVQKAYLCTIQIQGKKVIASIIESLDSNVESLTITLIQGLIKKDKWDFLLQKCSELGVAEIVPLSYSRSVVKVTDDFHKKLARFNKITLEACEQSKRDYLVQVKEPITLNELQNYKSDLNIVAYEQADASHHKLKNLLNKYPNIKSITIIIGSEGGFSQDEIDEIIEKGFYCVSLGKRILRAETAAIASIQSLMYHFDA